jgi:uncharacterized membrane protein
LDLSKNLEVMLIILIRRSLAVAASILVLLAVSAPLLEALEYSETGTFCRHALSGVCHQKAERSFHLRGHAMGLCVRCTAIYTAMPLGFTVFSCFWKTPEIRRVFPLAALFLIPMAVDGVMQVFRWYDWPWLRFATGMMAGTAVALIWHTLFSESQAGIPLNFVGRSDGHSLERHA